MHRKPMFSLLVPLVFIFATAAARPSGRNSRFFVDGAAAPDSALETEVVTSSPPCMTPASGDQNWSGNWAPNEPLPTIRDLDVHDGILYAAGRFDYAGKTLIRNLARWDGTQWADLDHSVVGTVTSMAWYGDELFVTGNFHVACAPEIINTARWKAGRGWLPAGNVEMRVLASNGQRLFALPRTNQPNTELVQWDGANWNDVAMITGYTRSLAFGPNGKVYVAGNITSVDGLGLSGVAAWDGNEWDNLGGGISGSCTPYGPYFDGVVTDGARIYVWGSFKASIGASGVAYYDTGIWHKASIAGSCGDSGGPDIDVINAILPEGNVVYYSRQSTYTTQHGSVDEGATNVAIGTTVSQITTSVAIDFATYNNAVIMGFGSDAMIWGGVGNRYKDALVASWNGTTLSVLGDGLRSSTDHGLPGAGRDILVDDTGSLYVGGLVDYVMDGYSGLYKMQLPDWKRIMPSQTSGMRVESVAKYKGALYVGGNVDRWAGRRHFARFDNESSLSVPAEDVNGLVHTMATDGKLLYLGGDFDHAGTLAVNHVVAWNGSQWKQLGPGLNGPVQVLTYSNGMLYAGGDFTFSSRTQVRHLAVWDGRAWFPVNKGADGPVYTILPTSDGLIIGGNFQRAGATIARNIATLSEDTWLSMGDGFDDNVYGLAMSDGGWLYATGRFTHSGAADMNRVARWDGERWWSMGQGLDNSGRDIVAVGKHIYLTGYFTMAGSSPSQYFAEWIEHEPAISKRSHDKPALAERSHNETFTLGPNSPNPFNPSTQIPFSIAEGARVRLMVYDAQGSLVRTLVNEERRAGTYVTSWNGRDDRGDAVASGVYFCSLRAGNLEATRKMVLLK